MRAKLPIIAAAWIITTLACGTSFGGSLLDDLGFPEPPCAKLITEINLPQNKVADLEREYASQLGLRNIDQVGMVEFSTCSNDDSQDIMEKYEPYLQKDKWETVTHVPNLTIESNDKLGVLIMLVDPAGTKGRTVTFLRVVGALDPSKKLDPGVLPNFVGSASGDSGSANRIPVDSPISVPPSEKFHLKATKSDIQSRILSQTTAEVRLSDRGDPGEMKRIDDRLVLELTPKLAVDEIDLPANVALLLELTEGSLTISGKDKPTRLNIVATGAPVTLSGVPLVAGTHSIKSVNGDVKANMSPVDGGVFEVEVTGADLTLTLPRNASASVKVKTTSGKIQNLTGLTPDESSDSSMSLKLGAGKADISLQAINGTVSIKYAD